MLLKVSLKRHFEDKETEDEEEDGGFKEQEGAGANAK